MIETAIASLSYKLGINPSWLRDLIRFESRWNPLAKNKISGAMGLIQFTNSTAKNLGFQSAQDLVTRYPTAEGQLLGPVKQYFELPGNQGPYPNKQSFYMTVFYPAARKWPEDKFFPDNVRKANPGINTVKDYINKVDGIILKNASPIVILIIGMVLYIISKKG